MKKHITTLLLLTLLASNNFGQNLIWAKAMGGSGNDGAYAMVTDASGNIYTTGRFSGVADFNPGTGVFNLTSAGNTDVFISKLDASGNFVWAVAIGGSGNDGGVGLALDASNNVYVTGYFEGTADFDPGSLVNNLTSSGSYDGFVMKVDSRGFYEWAKKFGGTGYDMMGGIAVSKTTGNVYSTGNFSAAVDFDPGAFTYPLTSKGNTDIFISCLNTSGDFVYAGSFGSTDYDEVYAIVLDATDNVFLSGEFVGTVDFDPGAGTTNLSSTLDYADIFIMKTDNAGKFAWVRCFEGKAVKHIAGMALDASGNILTTGTFNGTVDFNPAEVTYNLTSTGYTDAFISKLNSNGMFVWARSITGALDATGTGITTDAASNIYVTGYFNGTADFNPGPFTFNLTSAGNTDIFVMQLNANGTLAGAHRTGGSGYDYGQAIITDASSRCITAGVFAGTVDFDPGTAVSNITAVGSSDIYIAKQTLSAAGIAPVSAIHEIAVYPNPAISFITLQVAPDSYFVMSDLTGNIVMEGVMEINTHEIDVSHLVPGVYFIRTDNGVGRFLKQ